MTNVTFISGHYAGRPRRAGMHNLAEAAIKIGVNVNFVTAFPSVLGYVQKSPRLIGWHPNDQSQRQINGLTSWTPTTLLHPFDARSKLLNSLQERLFSKSWEKLPPAVKAISDSSDLIILETGLPLLWLRALRETDAKTLLVRMSDGPGAIRFHPKVAAAYQLISEFADVVSSPSSIALENLQPPRRVEFDPMGVPDEIYHHSQTLEIDPQLVVCAGDTSNDPEALEMMVQGFPGLRFEIYGTSRSSPHSNLIYMGEKPLAEIIPAIRRARLCIAPYYSTPEHAYQAHHSNRLKLYEALGKPVVKPKILGSSFDDYTYAENTQIEISTAINRALAAPERPAHSIVAPRVPTWSDVMKEILQREVG